MKSENGALNLSFMGGMTQFSVPSQRVRKFQVKTFGNTNDSEITDIARQFGHWAACGAVDGLRDFENRVPTAMYPGKWEVPLSDYGIYLDVDFAHDIYQDKPGFTFKAMLTAVKFSIKKGEREAVFTFVKNGESSDEDFISMFLNDKESDGGKLKPKAYNIKLSECEAFSIGNDAEESSDGGSDDLDDDNDVMPEVFGSN